MGFCVAVPALCMLKRLGQGAVWPGQGDAQRCQAGTALPSMAGGVFHEQGEERVRSGPRRPGAHSSRSLSSALSPGAERSFSPVPSLGEHRGTARVR